jgi:hypothetical protein
MDVYWFQQAKAIVVNANRYRHLQGESLLHVGAHDLFASLLACYDDRSDESTQQKIRSILLHALLESDRFYPNVSWKESASIIDWCVASCKKNLQLIPFLVLMLLRPCDRHSSFRSLIKAYSRAWHAWDQACTGRRSSDYIKGCYAHVKSLTVMLEILVYHHDMPYPESQLMALLDIQGDRWSEVDLARLINIRSRICQMVKFQKWDPSTSASRGRLSKQRRADLTLPLRYLASLNSWSYTSSGWYIWLSQCIGLRSFVEVIYRVSIERWLDIFINDRAFVEQGESDASVCFEWYMDCIDEDLVELLWWLEDQPKQWVKEARRKGFLYRLLLKRLENDWSKLCYRYTTAYQGYAAERVVS